MAESSNRESKEALQQARKRQRTFAFETSPPLGGSRRKSFTNCGMADADGVRSIALGRAHDRLRTGRACLRCVSTKTGANEVS